MWPWTKWKRLYQSERNFTQWFARAAFELGYKAAGGKKDWRDEWRQCSVRRELVAQGYINESAGYK